MKRFNDDKPSNFSYFNPLTWFGTTSTTPAKIPKDTVILTELLEAGTSASKNEELKPVWQKVAEHYFPYVSTYSSGEHVVAAMLNGNNIDTIFDIITNNGEIIFTESGLLFNKDVELDIQVHLNALDYVKENFNKFFVVQAIEQAKIVLKDHPQYFEGLFDFNDDSDKDFIESKEIVIDYDSGSEEISEEEFNWLEIDAKLPLNPLTFVFGYDSDSEDYITQEADSDCSSAEEISEDEIKGLDNDQQSEPVIHNNKRQKR